MEECGCKSAGVVVWWSVRDGGAQAWAGFSGHAGREKRMGFWGSFGLRAAHGQGKYALAVPAATTEFWKSARQLPSSNLKGNYC